MISIVSTVNCIGNSDSSQIAYLNWQTEGYKLIKARNIRGLNVSLNMHLQNNCFSSSWWAFLLHSNATVPGPAWCQIKKQYLLSEMIFDLIWFKMQTIVAHFDAWVEEFVNVLIWTEQEIHGRPRSPESIKLNRAHLQRSRREQHSLLFLSSPHSWIQGWRIKKGDVMNTHPLLTATCLSAKKNMSSINIFSIFHSSHIL